MIMRVRCPGCGSLCEYDNKSVWEGNREMEDFECPKCNTLLDRVLTDKIPIVRIIESGINMMQEK